MEGDGAGVGDATVICGDLWFGVPRQAIHQATANSNKAGAAA
jgi:hypothetical protein